jgi:hypothetical protein
LRIKNWSKFQHFKDRRPPWVKLYRDLLDDIEWHELDPLSAKVLVMLWLIASEDLGALPDIKTIAFRLRMPQKQVSDCISKLSHWLDHSDIEPISNRYQDDPLEKEKETEEEKETEKRSHRGARLPADFVLPEEWSSFCRHERPDLIPSEVFLEFKDYWVAQPGQKGVKTDWDATWRNWIRRQNAKKKGSVWDESERRKQELADRIFGKGKDDGRTIEAVTTRLG